MVEIEIGKVAVIESGEGINIVLRCSSNFIASAEISKFREEMNIWYFNRLIVPARFRNLGYGKKLLTKLVQVCKEKKINLI
jgi:GNAT superfamily N-acetyltransferase